MNLKHIIPGKGRVSYGKKITFDRVIDGVAITLYGKRGARIGYIRVDYAELKAKVAGLPEDMFAKEELNEY